MIKFNINSIKLYGFHGLYERERELGQFFKIDIAYTFKNEKPYPDYTEIIKTATDAFLEYKYRYIEEVAEALCNKIIALYRLNTISVTITKLHPPLNMDIENVSCTVEKHI